LPPPCPVAVVLVALSPSGHLSIAVLSADALPFEAKSATAFAVPAIAVSVLAPFSAVQALPAASPILSSSSRKPLCDLSLVVNLRNGQAWRQNLAARLA
jgi:hypothetical protein